MRWCLFTDFFFWKRSEHDLFMLSFDISLECRKIFAHLNFPLYLYYLNFNQKLLIWMKTFRSCYIIIFLRAIHNGSCIIMLFSRNIFFSHLTRPNSIFNKNLIALDILQALITFLLNNPAVWYRCLFQEKHSIFPRTKGSKFFGSRSKL